MRTIITGGPGTGKTSLLKYFGERGYTIVPEVARDLFAALKLYHPEQLGDRNFVQNAIEAIHLRNYHVYQEHAIFDRGLPDEHAYRAFYEISDQGLWERCYKTVRYDQVFILPFWPEIYEMDDVRSETIEQAEHLDFLTRQSYIACGYDFIEVPKMDLTARANFIRDNLK